MTLLIFDNDTRKPIYARSGALIPQAYHSDILNASIGQTTEAVKRRTDYLLGVMSKKGKRNCVVRSFSSYLYNCVGMIFASRRAWIEINEIYSIFQEDGYHKIKYGDLGVGDIVVYTLEKSPEHVGLVTNVLRKRGEISSVVVLSKWGRDAEVLHPLHVVPASFGSASEFWSEKNTHDTG